METKEILQKVQSGELSVEEAQQLFRRQPFEEMGYERKEAMKQVARDRGVSKREVYACLHRENRE